MVTKSQGHSGTGSSRAKRITKMAMYSKRSAEGFINGGATNLKICKNNATRGANTAGMRGDSLIVEFGDTEYVITSDPMPTGRDREWKASATTIDGHQAT